MCGILGQVSRDAPALDQEGLRRALGHRGPDSSGMVTLDARGTHLLFGHTRLAIVDLSDAGAQPMRSRSGRWTLTYNGEVYNHDDLRRELAGPFHGHCDTETIVEALDAWGFAKTVRKLNGIFAFAAYDRDENRLYLARDPFGVKPLYYSRTNGGLVFSSEVRGISALSPSRPSVDRVGVQTFLAYRFVPSPRTCWEGIQRLPPGHSMRFDPDDGSFSVDCYIEPSRTQFRGSLRDAAEQYESVLGNAVERQLLSDVPLGILLSGGVDSAVVAALACRGGGDLTSFTVGFGQQYRECEVDQAAHTADVLGLRHEHVLMTPESAWQSLAPAIRAVEEPLGTTSILPMWHLSELASSHVKAVLTGQGSDEPLGGYRRYQVELANAVLPNWLPWKTLARAARHLPNDFDFVERGFRSLAQRDTAARFRQVYALFTEDERRALCGDPIEDDEGSAVDKWLEWATRHRTLSPVEQMMAIDSRMNLSDDLLLYGDKITMAHALEARVPILDLEVIDFIESLPRAMRLQFRKTKIVHKEMAERLLPASIIHRPKLGFQIPADEWFRSTWKRNTEDYLLSRTTKLSSLVDISAVERVWTEHLSGKRDRTRQLFALLGLAIWAEDHA